MILTYMPETERFVFLCSYHERERAKSAGFRWDPNVKHWWTGTAERARQLEEHADTAAKRALGGPEPVGLSYPPPADVPCPPGLALMPYQAVGVAYALARRDVLIADEMGLGKTIQAIGVVNALHSTHRGNHGDHDSTSRFHPKTIALASQSGGPSQGVDGSSGISRVLIVCPASLRLNWKAEWTKWSVGRIRPLVVTDTWFRGIELIPGLMEAVSTLPPVAVILSYAGMKKHKAAIDRVAWDVAIFDEAHALKNHDTQQSKAVFGYYARVPNHPKHQPPIEAKKRIFLTGTPIVNKPEELWPMLHSIDPTGLGADRRDYFNRYVDPPLPPRMLGDISKWISDTTKWRRADLHARLVNSVMIRRLKADVLTDLPPKRRQMVLLDVAGADRVLAAERSALSAVAKKRAELELLPHEEAVKALAGWRGASMAEIARIRHETAVAKIPAMCDHILTMLDGYSKIVVFAHHHDVLDALKEIVPTATVSLDGRNSDKEKDNAVKRFQEEAGVRLFVGGLRAAGLGITLTAASAVAFAELDWTPAAMVQAEDRMHRIGQRQSVHVQHLVLDESIDCHMSRILIAKAEMIDAIVDGKSPPDASESVLDEVLKARRA